MKLFCAIFRHWPVPFGSRRVGGMLRNRCWLCESPLVHRDGEWCGDEGESPSREQSTEPLRRGGSTACPAARQRLTPRAVFPREEGSTFGQRHRDRRPVGR
jgi:hypothetical protein